MNTQFKKGILELCVLYLIKEQDMSGYKVVDCLSHYIDVTVNTIYPILRRLASEKILATYEDVDDNNRKIKVYTLTKPGQLYYEQLYQEWNNFNAKVQSLLKGDDQNE
jgi:PadR family transcriptional regulator PadR